MQNPSLNSRRLNGLGVAAALAVALGVLTPIAIAPTPAEAACRPVAASWNKVVVGNLYTYLGVNSCGAKRLHDEAGKQSAKLIIPSLLAGWIPGNSGKLIGTALGTQSGVLWLTQNKLKTCTKNFTKSATITFYRGVPSSCVTGTRDRPGGGSF